MPGWCPTFVPMFVDSVNGAIVIDIGHVPVRWCVCHLLMTLANRTTTCGARAVILEGREIVGTGLPVRVNVCPFTCVCVYVLATNKFTRLHKS